jgi:hypothetical protein
LVEQHRLVHGFRSLCTTLLEERFRDRWEQPIAYWALGGDQHLPLAVLGRSVRNLAETSFDDLAATQGVGPKKIRKLLTLLQRAIRQQPTAEFGNGSGSLEQNRQPAGGPAAPRELDPSQVSEGAWAKWRATVRRFGVDREKLGRLIPTLKSLPVGVWHTPLQAYCNYSLAEIRNLKTHGEKRVRAILEVFAHVHELLGGAKPTRSLAIRLLPEFVVAVEFWIDQAIAEEKNISIDRQAVCKSVVLPLLEQVRIDLGDRVREIAAVRLGINGPQQSVREQSLHLQMTRARVYQLLSDCVKMMEVRWPEGRSSFSRLMRRLELTGCDWKALNLLRSVMELFFPTIPTLPRRSLAQH